MKISKITNPTSPERFIPHRDYYKKKKPDWSRFASERYDFAVNLSMDINSIVDYSDLVNAVRLYTPTPNNMNVKRGRDD